MKKRYHLLASIFILATLPLIAEDLPSQGEEIALESQETAQFGNRKIGAKQDNRKKCKECVDPGVYVVPEEIAIENQKAVITPTVYPYVSQGMNLYVTLDFLWWQTVIGGTGFAYNGSSDGSTNSPIGQSVRSGSLERPDFGFNPGMKLAVGSHFDHDGWDLSLEYTYLPASGDDAIAGSPDKGAKSATNITTGDGTVAPISILAADSEWNQHFNTLDLKMGRNFFISRFLTLDPFIGMKAAWVSETFTYDFSPTPETTDPRIFGFGNHILAVEQRNKQSMYGFGLRGGIDTMWHLNKHFGFYGDLAITSLWGSFHIVQSNKVLETLEGEYTTFRNSYRVRTLIPIIETGLGFAYMTWYSEDKFRFQLQAGWEHQIWIDFTNFQQQMGSGSLTNQGLSVKAGLTF